MTAARRPHAPIDHPLWAAHCFLSVLASSCTGDGNRIWITRENRQRNIRVHALIIITSIHSSDGPSLHLQSSPFRSFSAYLLGVSGYRLFGVQYWDGWCWSSSVLSTLVMLYRRHTVCLHQLYFTFLGRIIGNTTPHYY